MRDHKIALFQAREEDLLQELAERDQQLEDIEVSHSQRVEPAGCPTAHCMLIRTGIR